MSLKDKLHSYREGVKDAKAKVPYKPYPEDSAKHKSGFEGARKAHKTGYDAMVKHMKEHEHPYWDKNN